MSKNNTLKGIINYLYYKLKEAETLEEKKDIIKAISAAECELKRK